MKYLKIMYLKLKLFFMEDADIVLFEMCCDGFYSQSYLNKVRANREKVFDGLFEKPIDK